MISSVALSGMICLWASSYFTRTTAALVVSYLMILPLAMAGVLLWNSLAEAGAIQQAGRLRLIVLTTVVPAGCAAAIAVLWADCCRRLLRPPDLGAGGKQAIDLETEAREAVGLYIERDRIPDKWFAPAKRTTFLADNVNPIYDKEIRSEIFAQGTLMLRLVIQISMFLAIAVMAACLFFWPQWAAWYVAYVLLFNLLVGPVFSANSITSERERATLDLLLTTLITPWQMLWGKLLSGLRVSVVLTGFLCWALALACLMPGLGFWWNLPTMAGYFLIVAAAAATTAISAMMCSILFRKSSTSLMASYLWLTVMFLAPIAAMVFVAQFARGTTAEQIVTAVQITSPFAAAFSLPLHFESSSGSIASAGHIGIFWGYLAFAAVYNVLLLIAMTRLIAVRWQVSE